MHKEFEEMSFEKTSDEDKLKLILKYQETQDKKLFYQLLWIYDGYLVYLIRIFKKRYNYLREIDSQELYQEAITIFERAVKSMPKSWKPNKVAFRIGSYVKEYFKRKYLKLLKTVILPDYLIDQIIEKSNIPFERHESYINGIDVRQVLESNALTIEQKDFVKEKYYNNMSDKQLAQKFKITINGIGKRNAKINNILRKYLK